MADPSKPRALGRSRHYAKKGVVPKHGNGCDTIIDVHIETDGGRRWRVVHRCRCGLDKRADAWRAALTAAEREFMAAIVRPDLREAAE